MMQDYSKLVEALRERARREDEYYEHGGDVINDAATRPKQKRKMEVQE